MGINLFGETSKSHFHVEDALSNFTSIHEHGLQYNTIWTDRSTLSGFFHIIPGVDKLSEHFIIQRYSEGVYNICPLHTGLISYRMRRRLLVIWLPCRASLWISYKCETLLAIMSGQWIRTDSMTLLAEQHYTLQKGCICCLQTVPV